MIVNHVANALLYTSLVIACGVRRASFVKFESYFDHRARAIVARLQM